MASINLTSPSGFTSGFVIADTVDDANGALNVTQTITQVGGLPIAAALEIKSEKGALVLPRMTSAQRDALSGASSAITNGMMIYNTDTQSFNAYANSAWGDAGILSKTVVLTQAQILTLFNAATSPLLIPAPGAGFIIAVRGAALSYRFNTAVFANGGGVFIGYGTTPAAVVAASAISAAIPATFVNSVASSFRLANQNINTFLTATAANAAISIACDTANFTGGNAASTIAVTVYYSILPA